ncbi:MAG: hypothetical protein GC160_24295 [Acidobacteria bacterium]|nr:hypothetical protein [Acidobacteriota bacterium]
MKTTTLLLLASAGVWTIGLRAADPADPQPASAATSAFLLERPATAALGDDLPGWFTLSGEIRFRYEDRRGLGFQRGADDGYGLARTRVNIGLKPTSWLEFSFQGQDARAPGIRNAGAGNSIYRDAFDVRQAYVKIGGGEASPVAVTVGRQLLLYGDQRLIGPLDWTNTSRSFDAVKLELQASKDVKLDFFSASVVQNDPNRRLDQSAEGNNLHGFYGSVKNVIPKSTLEPYVLWQTTPLVSNELNLRGDLDRYTGGARLWGKGIGPWDYNLALVRQWGHVAGAQIAAWGSYVEVGYSLQVPWKPRFSTEYTFGSGDSDPTDGRAGGFNDLFPTAHLWYGYNDLVGWRNLKNVRLGAQIQPLEKLGLRLDYHSFWLANRHDGLYNVAGVRTVAAPVRGAVATKIGDEVDLTVTLPLTPILTLGGGVGYLAPGGFLKERTPGHGNTFTYLFVAYKL